MITRALRDPRLPMTHTVKLVIVLLHCLTLVGVTHVSPLVVTVSYQYADFLPATLDDPLVVSYEISAHCFSTHCLKIVHVRRCEYLDFCYAPPKR